MNTKTQLEVDDSILAVKDAILWTREQYGWNSDREDKLIDQSITHLLQVGYHVGQLIEGLESSIAFRLRHISDYNLAYLGIAMDAPELEVFSKMLHYSWMRCR